MAVTRKIPQRQCVGCGENKDKRIMIRVLKSDEGFMLDATGKKNGRGAYICKSSECLAKAIKNHGLERSFKMPIPDTVYESLKKEMNILDAE